MAPTGHISTVDSTAGGPRRRRSHGPCPESSAPAAAREVVVVEAAGCHLSDDALHALVQVGADYPLSVRRVDIASSEGRAFVRRFRAPMPPVVVVRGELLGWGRLSRGKLRRRLDQLATAGANQWLLTSGSVLAAFFAGGVALFAPCCTWVWSVGSSAVTICTPPSLVLVNRSVVAPGSIDMISAPRSATAAWRSGVVSPQAVPSA